MFPTLKPTDAPDALKDCPTVVVSDTDKRGVESFVAFKELDGVYYVVGSWQKQPPALPQPPPRIVYL